MADKKILVTQPLLPPLEEFQPYLEAIWESKWLTNNGQFHKQLEQALCDYLGVKHLCLFSNGTLALITALQALRITGEVITTPFSFVATTHSLWWNNIKPVFADIEPSTFNLDPEKVEAAITPQTTAIMPVHVYGSPCNLDAFQKIADTYNLKLIYDAAHAFGVEINHNSILNFGDLSILSFHATKVFNTIEGGAIICHDEHMKRHIDDLKNFGFRGETTVIAPGINAKMNELQAAFGLLQLKYVDNAIERRKEITEIYRNALSEIDGVHFLNDFENIKYTYSYFPILVDKGIFGMNRDELYDKLKEHNIHSRKYFYPLISNFPTYKGLPSSNPSNIPVANEIAEKVLCLPIYPNLVNDEIKIIISVILDCKEKNKEEI
jgi:dTDP-4-amino-4,6-dideoxygalactose transaminase